MFVAGFIGSPPMHFIARVKDRAVELPLVTVPLPEA
jgi:ABC-type sugar transport system ATPase subunit